MSPLICTSPDSRLPSRTGRRSKLSPPVLHEDDGLAGVVDDGALGHGHRVGRRRGEDAQRDGLADGQPPVRIAQLVDDRHRARLGLEHASDGDEPVERDRALETGYLELGAGELGDSRQGRLRQRSHDVHPIEGDEAEQARPLLDAGAGRGIGFGHDAADWRTDDEAGVASDLPLTGTGHLQLRQMGLGGRHARLGRPLRHLRLMLAAARHGPRRDQPFGPRPVGPD